MIDMLVISQVLQYPAMVHGPNIFPASKYTTYNVLGLLIHVCRERHYLCIQ